MKDVYELIALQTDFIGAQMQAMTELVKDLNEGATKTAMGSVEVRASQATVTLKNIAAALADQHGMVRKRADELLMGAIASITNHLKRGNCIRIAGLGTFRVRNRAARRGRHPATGEQIAIKASKTIAFRASKYLNEAISQAQIGGD